MNEFIEAVKREQKRILSLANLTGDEWVRDNQGILLLQQKGSGTYCYARCQDADNRRIKRYIGTAQSKEAKEFVRQRFLKEKHRRLMTDQALLEELLKQYEDYSFDAVMSALPDSYRKIAFEDFNNARYEEVKRWANADYEVNPAPFPNSEIYTQDGLRVRSKGECIHANIYSSCGIPFRFDSRMVFTDSTGEMKVYYPDFVIQCLNRKLIIIEHLGRLFDKKYALKFGEKCHCYLNAGFVLGVNFFVTSDDFYGGTDSRAIVEVAKTVERLFYGF